MGRGLVIVSGFFAAVVLAGCDDDDGGEAVDAGADAADDAPPGIVEPAPPADPAPAARPVLTPCPVGWREVADAERPEIVTCDPWPEGGQQACEGAFAHFPGEDECARIGSPCPAGGWAADLPGGASIVYVDAAAGGGGDGREDAPFDTIGAAVAAARDGDVIALAAGRYVERVALDDAVTLWGACAEGTVIAREDSAGDAVLIRTEGGATLRNLTVEGGENGVRVVHTDVPSTLDHVVVRGARFGGVSVEDGALAIHDSAVRDHGGDWESAGIWAFDRATVTLDRVSIERPGILGVRVFGQSHVDATAVTVSGTRTADLQLVSGDGLMISDGTGAVFRESVIHHVHRNALRTFDPETSVTLVDCAIHDVGYHEDAGDGAYGDGGAALHLERVSIDRTHAVALGVDGAGSVLEAADVVIRDVEARVSELHAGGFALVADTGARGTAERVAILRASGDGILVGLNGALDMSDVLVADTRKATATSGGWWAEGAIVYDGALTLTRAELLDNDAAGVQATGRLVATDLLVARGGANATDVTRSQGIVVFANGRAELHRVRLEENRAVGLAVEGLASVVGDDLTVVGTGPASDGLDGHGITIDIGATAELRRVRVVDNLTAGVAVSRASTATLEDVIIEGTREASCASDGCEAGGIGVQVTSEAAADLRRFVVRDNALAGAQVAGQGELDLHEGSVTGHVIGANVQDEAFDIARLNDVVLWDNERNLDAAVLPVPGLSRSEGRASSGCRTGPSEPLDIDLEPVGAPTWEPRGFIQTSLRGARGIASAISELLLPNHLFTDEGMYWGGAHPPPYDDEWVTALQRAWCASGTTFTVGQLSAPNYWLLAFMLVPTDGSAVGYSPDFEEGPILDDTIYPIACSGDVFHEGELFDGDFDTPYEGMEDISPTFDGFSHQVVINITNADYGPPGADLVGDYELRLEMIDATGQGWKVVSRFRVE